MRLHGFFSGSTLLMDKYNYIYCYGNHSALISFRMAFLAWWHKQASYEIRTIESLANRVPMPSLFGTLNPSLSFCFLKKAPKTLQEILDTSGKIFWQSPYAKGSMHQEALGSRQVAALACYDIKIEEMAQALIFYVQQEFKTSLSTSAVKEAAIYLCQEPHFFFSEAFKLAMGEAQTFRPPFEKDADVIGGLRFQSAVTLKNLSSPSPQPLWQKLLALRQQEMVFKSGTSSTHALLKYYELHHSK